MRALIASISMLILVIMLVIFGMAFLDSNTKEFLNMLDQSRQEYLSNDTTQASKTFEQLTDKFDKLRPVFCVLINHTEMAKAEISLLKIKAYMDNKDDTMFEAEYKSLVFTLKNIYSSECLTIANLF